MLKYVWIPKVLIPRPNASMIAFSMNLFKGSLEYTVTLSFLEFLRYADFFFIKSGRFSFIIHYCFYLLLVFHLLESHYACIGVLNDIL